MRKYTIPQSTTLTYLLGDHLGFIYDWRDSQKAGCRQPTIIPNV